MRYLTFAAAAAVGFLPLLAQPAAAQNVDVSGMNCSEAANELRDVVETNELDAQEADRLNTAITTAENDCENGDSDAMVELAGRFEDRNWNLDSDTHETN